MAQQTHIESAPKNGGKVRVDPSPALVPQDLSCGCRASGKKKAAAFQAAHQVKEAAEIVERPQSAVLKARTASENLLF